MRAVIQRVRRASVVADGTPTGACDAGVLILLGVARGDTADDAERLADKIAKLRIFSDEHGKMNLSVQDVAGSALVISNFTLCAAYAKGNRPDYFSAEEPTRANELYKEFVRVLRSRVQSVETGVFGADMQITTVLDGPITIVMESDMLRKGGKS